MPQFQHFDFPVHSLEAFKKHVLAFPARETEEGWRLNQSTPHFQDLVNAMKTYIRSVLSFDDENGAPLPEPTSKEVEKMCTGMIAQALRYFQNNPGGSHFSGEVPYHPREGVTEWKWILVYNERLYKNKRSKGKMPSMMMLGGSINDVMGMLSQRDGQTDPVEVLRKEVAKRAGQDPRAARYEQVDVDDLIGGEDDGRWGSHY